MMKRRDFLSLSLTAAAAILGRHLRAAVRLTKRSIDFDLTIVPPGDGIALGGDAAFLHDDATIRIGAFHGPFAADLDAIYMIGGNPLRFRAGSTNGVPSRFMMPVDPIDGLQFEIRPRGVDPIPFTLRVNSRAGATPLRVGKYIVALRRRDTSDCTTLTMHVDYGAVSTYIRAGGASALTTSSVVPR